MKSESKRYRIAEMIASQKLFDESKRLVELQELCDSIIENVEKLNSMWTYEGLPTDMQNVVKEYVLSTMGVGTKADADVLADKVGMYRTVSCAMLLKEGIDKRLVEILKESVKSVPEETGVKE